MIDHRLHDQASSITIGSQSTNRLSGDAVGREMEIAPAIAKIDPTPRMKLGRQLVSKIAFLMTMAVTAMATPDTKANAVGIGCKNTPAARRATNSKRIKPEIDAAIWKAIDSIDLLSSLASVGLPAAENKRIVAIFT
jgi:hypothetical protein